MSEQITTKLKAGKYLVPATLTYIDSYIYIQFKFNRKLLEEIKLMEGAFWCGLEDPPRKKIWRINNSPRNQFQLSYLQGNNPYAHYDSKIIEHEYARPLYEHQKIFSDFMLTYKHCILAGEMGTGKTLAAIEVMERSGFNSWWYVAPKSAIRAVQRELMIWKSRIHPRFFTYQGLVSEIKNWENLDDFISPQGVIFDESARIKNPSAQRSQAALILANKIRETHGHNGYVLEMSGAPAPRDPTDWWHQCEVACPGFLVEGTKMKLKKRLAIITERESITGGIYPHLESWKDDNKKCNICGKYKNDPIHGESIFYDGNEEDTHKFEPSKNEVARLYPRMKGLVHVCMKKDCLDLPDKQYQLIELEPSQQTLNIARSIVQSSPTVIAGITRLRELSDGFQYIDREAGSIICPRCNGSGKIDNPMYQSELELDGDSIDTDSKIIDCDVCGGIGKKKKYVRDIQEIESPKIEALCEILDQHIDIGRIVIFGGFTGSIDRCVKVCNANDWSTIRVDGRGWLMSENMDPELDPLEIFQNRLDDFQRVAFVGQPGAGGIGLTLTASPTILYYSNDFDADHRIQSEDRIHRPGMDLNRGATIIDLIHLETDRLILDNLKKKRKLQSLTLGQLKEALE